MRDWWLGKQSLLIMNDHFIIRLLIIGWFRWLFFPRNFEIGWSFFWRCHFNLWFGFLLHPRLQLLDEIVFVLL